MDGAGPSNIRINDPNFQNIIRDILAENNQHLHDIEKTLDIELETLKKRKREKDEIMIALHQYNDIKDVTQQVLGRLAVIEGVTVAEIHRKYNLLESD